MGKQEKKGYGIGAHAKWRTATENTWWVGEQICNARMGDNEGHQNEAIFFFSLRRSEKQ